MIITVKKDHAEERRLETELLSNHFKTTRVNNSVKLVPLCWSKTRTPPKSTTVCNLFLCAEAKHVLHPSQLRPHPEIAWNVSHLRSRPQAGWRREMTDISAYVPTTQEKFQNGDFTLKTHQIFYVHTTQGENWTRNNHRSFWICVRGKLGQGRKSHDYRDLIVFGKLRFQNDFRPP